MKKGKNFFFYFSMAGCIIIIFYNKFPEQGTPPFLVPFFPFCELFRQEPAPAVFITVSLSPGPKSSIKIVGFSLSGCFVGNHFILSEKPPQSNNMYMGKRPFLFSRHQAGPMHPSPGNGKRPCQSARRNPHGKFRGTGADSTGTSLSTVSSKGYAKSDGHRFYRSIPLRFEGTVRNSRISVDKRQLHRSIFRRLESPLQFPNSGTQAPISQKHLPPIRKYRCVRIRGTFHHFAIFVEIGKYQLLHICEIFDNLIDCLTGSV